MKRIIAMLIFAASLAHAQTPQMFRDWQAVVGYVPQGATTAAQYPPFNMPNMTASNAPSPYVVTASSDDGSRKPWMAFDGREDDNWDTWQSAVTNQAWIKVDMGTSQVVTTISLIPLDPLGSRAWRIDGSQDDSTYTVLDFYTNASNVWEFRTVANPNYYRYYRLSFLTNFGSSVKFTSIKLSTGTDLIQMALTNDSTPPFTVSALTYSGGYNPYLAFNHTVASYLDSDTVPNWLKINMGSNVVCNGFDYYGGYSPWTSYSFAGSTDDVTYVTNNSGALGNVNGLWLCITNSNKVAYRYYCWKCLDVGWNYRFQAKEIRMKYYNCP